VVNSNLNAVNFTLNSYKVPFKGENADATTSPIDKKEEFKQQRELASKECAYATKATAMAQILTGNSLKYSTTPEEYSNDLIKQGKLPNKNFYVTPSEDEKGNGTYTKITELNSEGEKVKETVFVRDNKYSGSWNEQYFYNPKYCERPYKGIAYKKDGSVVMNNSNVATNKPTDSYSYRPDGSLEYYHDYKNDKGTHISKDGKITSYDLTDKDGNHVKREYDDSGNLIFEDK